MKYPTLNKIRAMFERARLRAEQSKGNCGTADLENQISIDKVKVKQAFEKTNAKVQSLTKANETLTEENKTVTENLNKLQSEYRHDVIVAMHQCCWWFKTLEDKKYSIQSFEKSGMSFDDIATILVQTLDYQLLHTKGVQTGSTKLPQRSITTEEEQTNEENKRMRERRNNSYIE